jgi:hypothetical protein
MLRLNLTDQSEEQVLSVGALLDSQRHRGRRNRKLRAIRKRPTPLMSHRSARARFRQLTMFGISSWSSWRRPE